jgi:hypothetical protein
VLQDCEQPSMSNTWKRRSVVEECQDRDVTKDFQILKSEGAMPKFVRTCSLLLGAYLQAGVKVAV